MVSRTEKLQLMNRLAREARDYIAAGIGRRTYGRLRESLRFVVTEKRVVIFSTYYWIRFVNDGRRAIVRRPGERPLIFYADPFDDPRIALDYPQKPSQIVRLTPDQLRRDRAAGKLIFARSVKSVPGEKFIEAGIRKFRKEGPKELRKLIRGRINSLIRRRRGPGGRYRISAVL